MLADIWCNENKCYITCSLCWQATRLVVIFPIIHARLDYLDFAVIFV